MRINKVPLQQSSQMADILLSETFFVVLRLLHYKTHQSDTRLTAMWFLNKIGSESG